MSVNGQSASTVDDVGALLDKVPSSPRASSCRRATDKNVRSGSSS
jgi:hypothetical protein